MPGSGYDDDAMRIGSLPGHPVGFSLRRRPLARGLRRCSSRGQEIVRVSEGAWFGVVTDLQYCRRSIGGVVAADCAMTAPKHERNAEILRLHVRGVRNADIARQLHMRPDRVRDIIKRDERRKQHRAELEAKYGKRPKVATLPDDTPLEVLALCDGKVQGWATRIWHLANGTYLQAPIATLGELRRTSDAQLLKTGNVGKKLVGELRRFCPGDVPSRKLQSYRDVRKDARAALRMIREVVEQYAPPGSVRSEEDVEPPFVEEAEALVRGILAIVRPKS